MADCFLRGQKERKMDRNGKFLELDAWRYFRAEALNAVALRQIASSHFSIGFING